jgi:ribosomal protein L7/L12
MKRELGSGAVIQTVTNVSYGSSTYSPTRTKVDVIRALNLNGKIVLAIKMVREETGFGLLEAKKIVEGIVEVGALSNDPWNHSF